MSEVCIASGDSMRFTLQPIFSSPSHLFRCHLRRHRPRISYQLWFYVSVPSVGFETPRMRINVTSATGPRHVTLFLSVHHVTGLAKLADDDVIITGRWERTAVANSAWNYSVLPVGEGHVTRDGDAWRQIESHAISNNIRVLTAEPDIPFAFSTSSWVAQSTNCNVDITHFRPVNKLSRSQSGAQGQKVMADVIFRDGVFEYRLKSPSNPPHVKFLIPGMLSETFLAHFSHSFGLLFIC